MSANHVLVKLKANGLPCWHVLDVPPAKIPLLKRLQAGEDIDVSTIGRVVESGWGEPPQNQSIDYSKITA